MNKDVKEAIEEYQCPGCVIGGNTDCGKFTKSEISSCESHVPGTVISGIGTVYLGMPRGLDRLGVFRLDKTSLKIEIYTKKEFSKLHGSYDKFNVPVWRYKNKRDHIFVRGYMPRVNKPFLHIHLDKTVFNIIPCFKITDKDLEKMD